MATASLWFDNPSPPLAADDLSCVTDRLWDLVVVGGGIVGLLCALQARQRGRDVCLIDAGRVGEATTAHATVKVTSGHGALLADIAERHGRATAVAYQRVNDAGFAQLSALAGSLPEDVGWTTSPHIVYASTDASIQRLRKSALLAAQAGSAIAECAPPAWSSGQAWSWASCALVQPVSLARALGRALQTAGVPVVEHARVVEVRDATTLPRVRLESGAEVRSRDVLVASHALVPDPDRHTLRLESYRHAVIATPVGVDEVPTSYDIDGMSTRPAMIAGSPGAVVVGPAHRTGTITPADWTEVLVWATDALEAERATHRWAAQDLRSVDLLPYVGRTRRSHHLLVATGFNGWGFTNAAAVADQLTAILDDESPGVQEEPPSLPWQARRLYPTGGLGSAGGAAWWVARSLVSDHARSTVTARTGDLMPGQGRVVDGPVHPRAECMTAEGRTFCVSARCTHLGCLVRWNSVEESWDCPCHGSRFAPDGRILEGPARHPLEAC